MRKSTILLAIIMIAAMSLGQGQNCPVQVWHDVKIAGYDIDPNRIITDPVSGAPAYLGKVTTEVGRQWEYAGYGCDEDGHPMVFTSDKGIIEQDGALYTLKGTQTAIGVAYINITVTDIPDPNQVAKSTTGTLAIVGLPANNRPTLCGGRP